MQCFSEAHAVELTYKDASGRLGSELLYRDSEALSKQPLCYLLAVP